jgi:hypothetical protein
MRPLRRRNSLRSRSRLRPRKTGDGARTAADPATPVVPVGDTTVPATPEALNDLTVDQLRQAAQAVGAPTTGRKADLVDRVVATAAQQQTGEQPAVVAEPAPAPDAPVVDSAGTSGTADAPQESAQPAPAPDAPAPAPEPAADPTAGAQPAPEPAPAPADAGQPPATPDAPSAG